MKKDLAIEVENISKIYRIGTREKSNDNFAGAMFDYVRSPLENFRKYKSLYDFSDVEQSTGEDEDPSVLWALRDVSFEIPRGEVVGVIGTNGAGKSTLLKILSRITPPTRGQVGIRGRVSSLLEVGTGFHQELTGRENVYLNGTILGMRKREVDRKFDEIVDFSGVDKFLDTPVKRYSSGMRVRLAFAVAAHLEPEILIIDEVLAVGDATFQQKCMNKMQDVGQQGRTVLFVSHNMAAVTRLCPRAILLDQGGLVEDGPSNRVVEHYLKTGLGTTPVRAWDDLTNAPGDDVVRLRRINVSTEQGESPDSVDIRRPLGLRMEYRVLKEGKVLFPYFIVTNEQGVMVFSTIDQDPEWLGRPRPPGDYVSTAWIPGNLLSEGIFYVNPVMRAPERRIRHFNEKDAVAFNIIDPAEGDSSRGHWTGRLSGVVRPMLRWETEFTPA
ncbi:MAG: ABC transporter ATP-binding protein [Pseudomonadota bacterium]|nr:ABC transporter ATP-binding protein [Pseudomonadota bacterium]